MFVSIALAVVLSGPVQQAESEAALVTFHRLTAAALTRTAASAEERAALIPLKERLRGLLIYVEKCHQVMQIGRWTSQDYFNYLQVTRDLVDAGEQLCVFPEERLCWQRAGLNLADANYRFVRERVAAGIDPPSQLNQGRAQLELFKAQYNRTLKQLSPMPQ